MKDQPAQSCFQFKASFSPCTIMQITRYDLDALEQELSKAISRAPNFFIGSPVVIDLEKVKTHGTLDFLKIKKILQAQGMVPVGVRGGESAQHEAAATLGLPAIAIGGKVSSPEPQLAPEPEPQSKPSVDQKQATQATETTSIVQTKLITTPIRSGMQVYAKDSDLVVVAPVSAGAELIADGHIHIYGTLRGRALAGVQGNTNARIFCQHLDAELVSIAGYYLMKEDLHTMALPEGMVQIYLENEQVKIQVI